MSAINAADIPETKRKADGTYRLSTLAVGDHQLEDALTQLEANDIRHKVDEHNGVDTTNWSQQPDGQHTVYAVYACDPETADNSLITGGTQ